MKPFIKINEWLENEKLLGVTDPQSAILSTVSGGTPHSRIVAIRKIKDESLVFFTSKQTKKVKELLENPKSSMNFSLSMQGRQIVLEGMTFPLEQEENQHYWENLPRERQLRFSSYAPFSGRKVNNLNELEKTKKTLEENFKGELWTFGNRA